MSASPAVMAFWANEAPAILTELYGEADGEKVLDLWMKHRCDHLLKVMLESIAKYLAPAPHVAMAEAEYMAEFIEHRKNVRAHLALTQCNSEVQPDEPSGSTERCTTSYETEATGPLIVVADQSEPSQSSCSQHRDQLTKWVAGLVEAGVLETSAYQDFLASTPLPDRDQVHGLANKAMQQVQTQFNEKQLQWIDS